MLIIEDPEGLRRALALLPDDRLRRLLAQRRDKLLEDGVEVGELGPSVVVEPADALAEIEAALGFPVATNLVDGETYPSPDFTPSWEWCLAHPCCYEIAYVMTDDGTGAVLFVPRTSGVDATLSAIIATYADGDALSPAPEAYCEGQPLWP